ncbi:MAG: cold shock domain-containing protein [Alphaproteobacteria bacterium]|nr:cold shock domain-containing protein [Alphaproteobacteria bacterium]
MDTPIIDPPDNGAIRVKGTVKWFDPIKGFGFIVSKDVTGDVLLHRTVIEEYGCTTVLEGATVECDVIQKVKGLQARKLHSLDNSTAAPAGAESGGIVVSTGSSSASSPKRARAREILLQEPTGPAIEAECKWFSRPKGFGFVVARGGADDIFVHMDLLRKFNIRELRQNQWVLVRVGRGPKGLTATEIHLMPELPISPRSVRLVSPAEFEARP